MTLSNSSCHYLGACLSSYNDFSNLQILCSCFLTLKPLDYSLYIFPIKSSFKKIVLISISCIIGLYIDTKAIKNLVFS